MIRKLQITSNCQEYGPKPAPDDEIEQHLTLLSDGRVWLSRFRYGSGFKYELLEKKAFRIHTADMGQIMQAAEECFHNDFKPVMMTDAGTWTLVITYKDGTEKTLKGALCRDERIERRHLSGRIRTALDIPGLFLFDKKQAKKPDELIFCDVTFDSSNRTYCYLADTDEYEAGDKVVVLAGKEQREAIVEVVSVRYITADKAPYPLDKIKHILRKHTVKNPVSILDELIKEAYAPYDTIKDPTASDWKKSYDALVKLADMKPEEGRYPNTLGYLCYYGRHTGGVPQFEEARKWFEQGAKLNMIESIYKLADMMYDGLGGPKDIKLATQYYNDIYWYCRAQLEDGIADCKFADIALRVGKLFQDGIAVEKDSTMALSYLLEARFAIEKRKPFNRYGDDNVAKNIESAIAACEQPEEFRRKEELVEYPLGRVPYYFLMDGYKMSFTLAKSDDGYLRIDFTRRDKSGQAGRKLIWAIPMTMECFLTSSVTLFGTDVQHVWNKHPGKRVFCDRYDYDEETDTWFFYFEDDLKCTIVGGNYYLYMTDLRPMRRVYYKKKLDPYKFDIYKTAEKLKDEQTSPIIHIKCPLCGGENLYVSTDESHLLAFCEDCHESIDVPWPDDVTGWVPFDSQRNWEQI